ncbi:unnamed protein product, partial [Strongylus vulgaris]
VEAGPNNTTVSFVRETIDRKERARHALLQTASERSNGIECLIDTALELEKRDTALGLEKRGVPIKWASIYQTDLSSSWEQAIHFPIRYNGSFTEIDRQVLRNHYVDDENLIPGAYQYYILLKWLNSNSEHDTYFTLVNIKFINPWKYEDGDEYELVQTNSNTVHIIVRGKLRCRSQIRFHKDPFRPCLEKDRIKEDCTVECNMKQFYDKMAINGLDYRDQFRAIKSLKRSQTRTYSSLEQKRPPTLWALMDAAMHAVCVNVVDRRPDVYFLPVHIGEIYLCPNSEVTLSESLIAVTEKVAENEKFIDAHGCIYADNKLIFQYKNQFCLILKSKRTLSKQINLTTDDKEKMKDTKKIIELLVEEANTPKESTSIYILSSDASFCSSNKAEIWQQLKAGILEKPTSTEDVKSASGTTGEVDITKWDPEFFGITPKEAPFIDVQQRLMLQSVSRCLENAKPLKISKNTGVFIGVSGNDFTNRVYSEIKENASGYYSGGTNGSCIAGRI